MKVYPTFETHIFVNVHHDLVIKQKNNVNVVDGYAVVVLNACLARDIASNLLALADEIDKEEKRRNNVSFSIFEETKNDPITKKIIDRGYVPGAEE